MNAESIQAEKLVLRRRCLAVRQGLPAGQVAAVGRAVLERVMALEEYRRARLIHVYVSTKGNEVDTWDLIRLSLQLGKRLVVPVVRRGTRVLAHAEIWGLEQLHLGRWGLYGPAAGHDVWLEDLPAIGLVVVPGLAFDPWGRRLGLGGGYYDRFLGRVSATKVGLGYQCLVLDHLPEEPHDALMDLVVTEAAVYRARAARLGEPG